MQSDQPGNPFDDDGHAFLILRNGAGQHSIWPNQIAVPRGWTAIHGPAPRSDCVEKVGELWTDFPRATA